MLINHHSLPSSCPRDPSILGGLEYQSDLQAGTSAFVFKFADKPRVYFTCQVRTAYTSCNRCNPS